MNGYKSLGAISDIFGSYLSKIWTLFTELRGIFQPSFKHLRGNFLQKQVRFEKYNIFKNKYIFAKSLIID